MRLLPGVRFGVIDDARRRQRRRWLGWSLLALVTVVAVVLASDRAAPEQPRTPPPPSRPARFLPPRAVFSQAPSMGVSCGTPNSTRCDTFGLAVDLKRPALSVQATVRGRAFALDDPEWSGTPHRGRRKMFVGFLRHARLHDDYHLPLLWDGPGAPSPLVRLRIDYGGGQTVRTHTHVLLRPGWG
jgi:hypothetical protein